MANLNGYSGRALKVLNDNGIPIWGIVELRIGETILRGMVLPAPENTEDLLYIKLENGYNVAFKLDKIREIKLLGRAQVEYSIKHREISRRKPQPHLVLIGAGGTIASRVEYATGAVKPAFSPYELANAIPEIFSIADVEAIELFNIFSEDMKPEHWIKIAKKVAEKVNGGAEGIVIAHGTDTMHFSASALAFMLKNLAVPVVFTGAQRSSDRPASDAAVNTIGATLFAARGKVSEVMIAMHRSLDDNDVLIHRGVRARKMHSSRRDTFRTIGDVPIAIVRTTDHKIIYLKEDYIRRGSFRNADTFADAVFEEKVALLYAYPGLSSDIIDFLVDHGYRGIVIAGTGLGHVSSDLLDPIRRAIEERVIVAMTTQCIWGPVKLDVYERGRVLKKLGVLPADGMLTEVAYVKLGWLLGHDYDEERVKELFVRNLRYEIVKKEAINAYFYNV